MNDVNFLLKEENVSLTQVLEADDILQECRAENKALYQFLSRPEIRAELITLITEEPSKNVELTTQYRHAHIASEVLTSQLPTLRDRLAMDTVQMNRLCDFVNKDPPLNPLLASYFSKTIEMLFERSPKQDWYAHHIVCLHVLDFFKSRRDFLPNLMRHISTSAICDVFKCFFYLRDPFNKIIMEWLDDHQILENFIHIICGTYEPEELQPISAVPAAVDDEKGQSESNEKTDVNHKDSEPPNGDEPNTTPNDAHNESDAKGDRNSETGEVNDVKEEEVKQEDSSKDQDTKSESALREEKERTDRIRDVASANAAALLCEVALYTCNNDVWPANAMSCSNNGAGAALCARLRSEAGVRALLQAAFTAPPPAARAALHHAARLLLALLAAPTTACPGEDVSSVERAVAPHVPLLHHALLRPPRHSRRWHTGDEEGKEKDEETEGREEGVGAARVAVAAVLARLARAEAHDVFTALLSLGTAGVLIDLLFSYPENNFLHAQVLAFVSNALANRLYGDRYASHLIEECNLLTRLMDAFEENEDKFFATSRSRAGYMGHVVCMLRVLDEAGVGAAPQHEQRWDSFRDTRLRPHLQRLDAPLGGVYPTDNQYDVESPETYGGSYDLGEGVEGLEGVECTEGLDAEVAEEAGEGAGDEPARSDQQMQNAEMNFLGLADQRYDDMWGEEAADADEDVVQQVLTDVSPWECCESAGGGAAADGGWAQFGDAFAASDWPESNKQDGLDSMQNMQVKGDNLQDALTIELAQKMLTAFSCLGRTSDPSESPVSDPSVLDPLESPVSGPSVPSVPNPSESPVSDPSVPSVPDTLETPVSNPSVPDPTNSPVSDPSLPDPSESPAPNPVISEPSTGSPAPPCAPPSAEASDPPADAAER